MESRRRASCSTSRTRVPEGGTVCIKIKPAGDASRAASRAPVVPGCATTFSTVPGDKRARLRPHHATDVRLAVGQRASSLRAAIPSRYDSCPRRRDLRIAVPKETAPGERRVALVPESCKKLMQAGYEIAIEAG